MTINTVEELAGLPEGSTVTVNDNAHGAQQWAVSASGTLTRDGATVPASFFSGLLRDKKVTRMLPSRGDVYTGGETQTWLVLDMDGADTVQVVGWQGTASTGIETVPLSALAVSRRVVEGQATDTRSPLTSAQVFSLAMRLESHAAWTQQLTTALHQYLNTAGMPPGSGLEHLMTRHGMPGRTMARDVEVTVTGRVRKPIGTGDGSGMLMLTEMVPEGVSYDDPVVDFQFQFDWKWQTEGAGCVCYLLDEETVEAEAADRLGGDVTVTEWSLTCDSEDCANK